MNRKSLTAGMLLSIVTCGLISAQNNGGGQTPDATLLIRDGGRIDWSRQNRIAFDRRGPDGFYQIWVINPDGSGEHCLTCNQPDAPRKHKGNPAWDPSGRFIVFQGQKSDSVAFVNNLAAPGKGVANDLWIMDASGTRYWKLVDVPRLPAGGVLHPHFSPDGHQLFWSQLVKKGGKLGIWQLKVADFDVTSGQPKVSNIRTLTPGPVQKFFESHGFTPDGRKIIFTAQVPSGNSDIFEYDLSSRQLTNLTNTPDDWDEHAQISNDGRSIVWASTRNANDKSLNLWIMNADGNNPRMLMDSHAPQAKMRSTGIGPADSSWSPDSQRLAVYLISDQDENAGSVWIVNIGGQRPNDSRSAAPVQ